MGAGIDVWVCPLERAGELRDEYAELLSEQERDKAARFRFEHLRDAYLLGRGVTRAILARYLDRPAAGLHFRLGHQGKPYLENGGRWQFNVSHSGSLLVLGVTDIGELGIDIERIWPLPDVRAIAQRFFSANEAAELEALPPDQLYEGFFACWTRKEAFLKATGEGLSRLLESFEVSFGPGRPARFLRIDNPHDDAAAWSLLSFTPAPGYAGAVAIRAEVEAVHLRSFDPRGVTQWRA
jgi:4'-phosphopantetheinyl transferase